MVKRITVVISDELHYQIKLQAAKENRTISDKLREMLQAWINNLSPLETALRLLGKREWIDDGDEEGPHCPSCGNYQRSGHAAECETAKALAWLVFK